MNERTIEKMNEKMQNDLSLIERLLAADPPDPLDELGMENKIFKFKHSFSSASVDLIRWPFGN